LTRRTRIWNGVDMTTPFLIWERCLDVIYPPTCLSCEHEGAWVCASCLQRISFFSSEEEIVVLGYYAHPLVRALLTRLKYHAARCLLPPLTALVRRFRFERREAWPWAREERLLLCAIPSDEKRVRERGIDHTERLKEIVHLELVPWATKSNILRRKRRVNQNANLPHNQTRVINVREAFEVTQKINVAVLLIDDVYTTGATWNEAARVLTEAGASKVYGFVFAKG